MENNQNQQISSHILNRLHSGSIEVAGIPVKCISSNVRRLDISWDSVQLVSGLGKEGNLVLVEAVSNTGSRKYLENQQGVNQRLYQGDKFVGVLANRHSGTEESGDLPEEGLEIHAGSELHLLSTSGLIGINSGIPKTMVQEPLPLKALGLISLNGKLLDLLELCGASEEKNLLSSSPIILVCGTSSDVGKTTTSAAIIRALCDKGLRVAATKISGTGNMQDVFLLRDAGASIWLEFPDAGLPSTYTSTGRFNKGIYSLFNLINQAKPGIIVAEAGGDIIEANIPTFLANPDFIKYVQAIIIVSGDVLGMMGSVAYLSKFSYDKLVFLTDPKDRNAYATRKRVKTVLPGLTMFDSLNQKEVAEITEKILNYKNKHV